MSKLYPVEIDGWPPAETSPMASEITDLEGALRWIAAHDAEIKVRWERQYEDNEGVERALRSGVERNALQDTRITALEKRMLVFASLAAAGGGVLGNVVQTFLGP